MAVLEQVVVSLKDSDALLVDRVGGKTAALARLFQAGFPVPVGLCITTAAFRLALGQKAEKIAGLLRGRDLTHIDQANSAAKEIAAYLEDLEVPPEVLVKLRSQWSLLPETSSHVAIRSSATAEDRPDASFAGQYDSLLGVPSRDSGSKSIEAAIVACWRSFFSPHALAARAAHASLDKDEAIAVLIQPIIEAECAGICYSRDPIRPEDGLILIEAAWGLGPGVVDGKIATDTVRLHRSDFAVSGRHGTLSFEVAERRIVTKPAKISLNPAGGIHVTDVADEQRNAACLPEAWLQRVAQFALAAESLAERPQDIEWAIAAGQFWMLQSRPITTLPAELAQTPRFPITWDDENEAKRFWLIQPENGSERGILSPLEQDHLLAVESTREETCRFLATERNIALKICSGRPYFRPVPLQWSEAIDAFGGRPSRTSRTACSGIN